MHHLGCLITRVDIKLSLSRISFREKLSSVEVLVHFKDFLTVFLAVFNIFIIHARLVVRHSSASVMRGFMFNYFMQFLHATRCDIISGFVSTMLQELHQNCMQ